MKELQTLEHFFSLGVAQTPVSQPWFEEDIWTEIAKHVDKNVY